METVKIKQILDGQLNEYIPATFYRQCNFEQWGLDVKDFAALYKPSNEGYWDAWKRLLREAIWTDSHGHVWQLAHEYHLFRVRADLKFSDDSCATKSVTCKELIHATQYGMYETLMKKNGMNGAAKGGRR